MDIDINALNEKEVVEIDGIVYKRINKDLNSYISNGLRFGIIPVYPRTDGGIGLVLQGPATEERITSLILPNACVDILYGAFSVENQELQSLKYIKGNKIRTITKNLFAMHPSLKCAIFQNAAKVGIDAFLNCRYLETVDLRNATSIEASVFTGCSKLKNVILSDKVRFFRENLFSNCTELEELCFPSSLILIGDYCFQNDINLSNVIIPDSVEYIGISAFENCKNIKSITLPKSLKVLKKFTFSNCEGLRKVVIQNGCEEIEPGVFQGCKNCEIYIPDSVKTLPSDMFMDDFSHNDIKIITNSKTVLQWCNSKGLKCNFVESPLVEMNK